jgi:hypothetical protein
MTTRHLQGGEPLVREGRPERAAAEGGSAQLAAEGNGYFSGCVPGLAAGDRYRFRLDGEDTRYPDPASRYQPEGPHGPSQVVDPATFTWTDTGWRGVRLAGQVIYEMHIGTFTPEGTFATATRELPALAAAGITLIEVMPVADFPGRFGWGYDGVNFFAPTRLYGEPDDFRRFVDRAHAAGDEVRTVVAGYHWFTDWGRDTMIALEGLTMATGRETEAGYILRTFAHYIRDGLFPNLFPEGQKEGLYHTADATLWFFHAVDRYLAATGDRITLRPLLRKLRAIVDCHIGGTHFGIRVDPEDGPLRQGQEGNQLTWMDAKVDDWVVTPRRGKTVEINALWYDALRLLESWERDEHGEAAAARLATLAERARASFNQRFWHAEGGHLYDVVDGEHGDDAACRPNQIFAISLRHPVLVEERWASVLDVVRERLLTPVGLRSLAPGHPDYKPRYFGDLRARDAAYHQGTVWMWLIGPFIDAWLRVHPEDREGARRFLEGAIAALDMYCIGTLAEVFDAEPPFTPRGCVAQAWSVAEVLRAWVKTAA